MKKTIIISDNSLWCIINFREYIIRELAAAGYHVVLVGANDNFIEMDVPNYVTYEPINIERAGSNPFKDILYMFKLFLIYKKHNPSIIFHYTIKPNIYGSIVSEILRIPSVACITGLGYVFYNESLMSRCARMLYSFGLRRASKVLFLNKGNLDIIVGRKIIDPADAILLTGGEGIDTSLYRPKKIIDKKCTFLMVSRVLYDKGYDEFIEAAKFNPNCRFVLVGAMDSSNPMAVAKETIMADSQSGIIDYKGYMDKQNLLDLMQSATCIVLPSYHEGMSMTLMEALAMGKPIITTNIPGCQECVDHGVNGFIVPVKAGKELAETCAHFSSLDINKWNEMAIASRKKAENDFDVRNVYRIYEQLLDELR